MRAANLTHICPYTGLRSFTEEESLYFKGRDLQTDQISALLEQNKFLMVTGASGEGKSSLIYGGLIPNVRAGFFRAKYTNWVIADFRPERNPVGNMAQSLATHFSSDASTIETELRRGYSSLADLYTSSSYYTSEEESMGLTEQERKERKRNAANLMVIVDQFEEFFTNPENFYREAPSKDAQIVVNLVLETARIALKRDLPIYLVCTMRSDYIGQCSAFRGLPEYIGFSQFFVPRLKRKDLKQVIEEPAILSGNRIAQRLIERLVYDISDGVDQLPILQHALSRIWKAADSGNEEMDLLHYAMVGGMPAEELPDEDMPRFRNWLQSQTETQQKFYKDTGLHKIIEIHANQLYETAWEYYNKEHPDNPISQQDAKRIIALAFSCLTKIDNSRAVRNRMTLEEITGIINNPALSHHVVGDVLNIFREEGNSFVKPFKTEDPATHRLLPETVLDITHESLIRNWNKLNQWANREFEFYSTFLDFQKQLSRWKRSGKDSGYLLPIGPLTYFENWYNNCKPNVGWIRRYADTGLEKADAVRESAEVLSDTREFLKKSARREFISRTFMKYGARRIATITAIVIMVGLTAFYWYDAEQKRNEKVIERVRTEASALLDAPEVSVADKAIYLLAGERYQPGTLIPALKKFGNKEQIDNAIETYKQLLYIDKQHETPLKKEVRSLLSSILDSSSVPESPDILLPQMNKFLILLAMDQYYLPDNVKKETLASVCEKDYQLALRFFREKALFRPLIPTQLNVAIQEWLVFGKVTPLKIDSLLRLISPRSGPDAEAAFALYYPKGSSEMNGRFPSDFNGGFHTLASLYAAKGDTAGIGWCFRKLLDNNQRDYFELARVLNNHLNIIGYLYQYGHRDKVPGLLNWLTANTRDNPPTTLLRNVVIRSGYISHMYTINIDLDYYRSTRGYIFPNLYMCDRAVFDAMCEDYESAIRQMKNPAERNFLLAMQYKRKAMFYDKYWYDRKMPIDNVRLDGWLQEAVNDYRQTDPAYLDSMQSSTMIYNGDGVRTKDVKRRNLFIYPDYRDGWFSWTYHSDYFFHFLERKGLLPELYKTGADLENIHYWIARAFEWKIDLPPQTYSNDYPLPDSTLHAVLDFTNAHPGGKGFDGNLLRIILANHAFERGDTLEGLKQFEAMDFPNIRNSSNRYEYLEQDFFHNMQNQLAVNLAGINKIPEALKVAETFDGEREKSLCYLSIAKKLYGKDADPRTFEFLDSAYRATSKVDYAIAVQAIDPRFFQIQLLSAIGSRPINREAANILRDLPENAKFYGVYLRVAGLANEGNYYRALVAIPNTLTESQDLECRTAILLEACKAREIKDNDTRWKSMDRYLYWIYEYNDYLPN